MAGRTLEEYFVSLGIKGQNVVLKEIDKVKKKSDALSKTKSVQLKAKAGLFGGVVGNNIIPPLKAKAGLFGGVVGNNIIPPQQPGTSQSQPLSPEEKKENKKFINAINKFGGMVKNFATSAASLDPVATMQGMTNAMAKVAGGWEIFGFSAGKTIEGLGDLMNAGVGMAAGAVNSAKQSAAAEYGLSTRNVTTEYYGGGGIKQTDKEDRPIMSREEHSQLVMEIAGAYGRIGKPMQKTLDDLVESKDTAALGRVASGNWASTGTDKGWMLQQITNQTAGLPPSIAQAIQNSLLKNNAGEIQNKKEGAVEESGQGWNARWKNSDEDLQKKIYFASKNNLDDLIKLNSSFNEITVNLVKSGASLASCVDTVASAVNSAISKIHQEVRK